MLQLNSIRIKNYIIYDEATLHIDPGVTTIRGKNLDRKSTSASNGAGKSLIPGVIPGIFYDASPLPMKAKKNPKEGFSKNTELNLNVTDKFNNKFTIKKFFKGSVKLDLLKNDRPLKFRKKTDAKDRISRLMPLNEDQFYSLAYLDTKRSPVFQYGTDAQRHHFIESLYKLNIYDKLSERAKRDWDKNRELIQELELLDRQLSQKIEENPGDAAELKEKHINVLKKVETLRDRVSDLLQKLQQCRTYESLTEGLDLSKDVFTLQQELDNLRLRFKSVKLELKEAQQQNQQYNAFKSVYDKRLELENKLRDLDGIKVDKKIQEDLRKDKILLNEIEENISSNKAANKKIKSLKNKKFSISVKQREQAIELGPDILNKNYIKDRAKVKELSTSLSDTKNHLTQDHKNCPICNSLLDKKAIDKILSEKKTFLETTRVKLTKLKEMIEYAETEIELKNLKNSIQPVEEIKVVEKRIDKAEALLNKMRKKVTYTSELKGLPDVEAVEKISTKELEEKYRELEDGISALTSLINKYENLSRLKLPFSSPKKARAKKKQYEEQLEEFRPLLDKLQARSHNIGSLLSKSEVLAVDIEHLSKSVNELKVKTGDYKVLAALRKAFGAKGLRRQRVAQIGVAIEESLNKYAKMLFDFPIKFQLVITDTKFQILATRNGQVSDVRTLSGAESRYFSLLTLVALLPFCPTSQRIDTVFMDEIEANLDQSLRTRLINIFLPELLKIVPKVVIITPLTEKEFHIPKANQYMVVKKNGKSKLEKI